MLTLTNLYCVANQLVCFFVFFFTAVGQVYNCKHQPETFSQLSKRPLYSDVWHLDAFCLITSFFVNKYERTRMNNTDLGPVITCQSAPFCARV